MLLFGDEKIERVDWAQSTNFKNVVRSNVFKQKIVYVELKIQICYKVINNYVFSLRFSQNLMKSH